MAIMLCICDPLRECLGRKVLAQFIIIVIAWSQILPLTRYPRYRVDIRIKSTDLLQSG